MDGGATWIQQTTIPTNGNWTAVATSPDGSTLVAVDSGGSIYTYQNGVWTAQPGAGTNAWLTVGTSYDGSKVVVGTAGMWGACETTKSVESTGVWPDMCLYLA